MTVARDYVRVVAAGVSAHRDDGRTVAEVFLTAARGDPKESCSDGRSACKSEKS